MDHVNELHEKIFQLHEELRRRMKERHQRSVPFADELNDRWERARFLGFGQGSSIYDSSLVLGDVSVGENTWVGPSTVLDGSGGLSIGRNCSISAGVQIYSHDSVAWALSGGKQAYVRSKTSIGDCCYIGPYVVIAKGVRIGSHCLIGAHSLVSADVPDGTIAVGVPAKPRGSVTVDPEGRVTLRWESGESTSP